MTYAWLNLAVLALVVAVSAGLHLATPRARRASGRAVMVTLGALLLMTAVFDNIMIAVGLVGYDSTHVSGLRIGIAPLEDFAYSVVVALIAPTLWQFLSARAEAK